jgi:hypothetical protein
MEYTVEKFNPLKIVTNLAAAGADVAVKGGGNIGKGVDELAADGLKALDGAKPTTYAKRATNVGKDAGGAGLKNADEVAGTGLKNADEVAGTGLKNADEVAGAGLKNADEVAGAGLKNADEVAGAGLKNADEAADKLTDAAKTNQKLSSKIAKVLKENPGKTLAAVLIIAGTGAGLALATEGFNKSNNQPLTIINSYATKGGDEGDVTIEYTAASGVTVVDGDSVIVNPPNEQENLLSSGQVSNYFIPTTIYGQTIQVKSIISSSSIIINYPGLVGYAKKGVLTLQTTMENRLLDQAEKGVDAVKDLTGTVLGPILGPIQKMLGPYLKYAQGCCCCICCLILLSIIYKVSKMAN